MAKNSDNVVSFNTSDMFFEDLLYCSARYAFGRHTALAIDMAEEIASLCGKLSEDFRKRFAQNCKEVLMEDRCRYAFDWTYEGMISRSFRDSHSIINVVLDKLIEEKKVDQLPYIKSASVISDTYGNEKYDVVLEFDTSKRLTYSPMDLEDLLCWNDLFSLFNGDTVTVVYDSGKVQQEIECIESYMRVYNADGKTDYVKVYRPIDDFKMNKRVEPEGIIAIKYK